MYSVPWLNKYVHSTYWFHLTLKFRYSVPAATLNHLVSESNKKAFLWINAHKAPKKNKIQNG